MSSTTAVRLRRPASAGGQHRVEYPHRGSPKDLVDALIRDSQGKGSRRKVYLGGESYLNSNENRGARSIPLGRKRHNSPSRTSRARVSMGLGLVAMPQGRSSLYMSNRASSSGASFTFSRGRRHPFNGILTTKSIRAQNGASGGSSRILSPRKRPSSAGPRRRPRAIESGTVAAVSRGEGEELKGKDRETQESVAVAAAVAGVGTHAAKEDAPVTVKEGHSEHHESSGSAGEKLHREAAGSNARVDDRITEQMSRIATESARGRLSLTSNAPRATQFMRAFSNRSRGKGKPPEPLDVRERRGAAVPNSGSSGISKPADMGKKNSIGFDIRRDVNPGIRVDYIREKTLNRKKLKRPASASHTQRHSSTSAKFKAPGMRANRQRPASAGRTRRVVLKQPHVLTGSVVNRQTAPMSSATFFFKEGVSNLTGSGGGIVGGPEITRVHHDAFPKRLGNSFRNTNAADQYNKNLSAKEMEIRARSEFASMFDGVNLQEGKKGSEYKPAQMSRKVVVNVLLPSDHLPPVGEDAFEGWDAHLSPRQEFHESPDRIMRQELTLGTPQAMRTVRNAISAELLDIQQHYAGFLQDAKAVTEELQNVRSAVAREAALLRKNSRARPRKRKPRKKSQQKAGISRGKSKTRGKGMKGRGRKAGSAVEVPH